MKTAISILIIVITLTGCSKKVTKVQSTNIVDTSSQTIPFDLDTTKVTLDKIMGNWQILRYAIPPDSVFTLLGYTIKIKIDADSLTRTMIDSTSIFKFSLTDQTITLYSNEAIYKVIQIDKLSPKEMIVTDESERLKLQLLRIQE